MRLTWTSAIAAAVFIGAPASPAAAEDRPEAEQSRAGVEVDFLHTTENRQSINIVTTDLVANVGVTRHVFLDADIAEAFFVSPGESSIEAMIGNPTIGAHYAGRFNRRVSGFAGGAIGVPIARASDSNLIDELSLAAIIPRAWHDPYRFVAHVVPVVAISGLEVDLAPAFLRFELSPGVIFDFRNGWNGYVDVAGTAGVRAGFGLEGGLRAQGTFVLSSDDHAQTAIEPFLGYATPERVGLYVRYGLLVALDAPLGFGEGGMRVASHRLSLGAKF